MQFLVCSLLPAIFLLDFLRIQFQIPSVFLLLPELLSGLAVLLIVSELARSGRFQLAGKYVLLICVLILAIGFGIVISDSTTGPIVAGLRLYGKYFILFLLPIVYVVSERDLRIQLLVILGFLLIQLPIVILQRFVFHAGLGGDWARGTFGTGSMMAIVLLFGVSAVVALYHCGYLSKWWAALVGVCLAVPPMLAEVKGAFLLLPLAILLPSLFAPHSGGRQIARVAVSAGLCVAALSTFALLHSLSESTNKAGVNDGRASRSILEFYRNPTLVFSYMAPKLTSTSKNENRAGRVDGVVAPIESFWGDTQRMVSGLGIGAITESPVEYFSPDQHQDVLDASEKDYVAIARLLWEFGYFGVLLILFAYVMLWRDVRRLSKVPSLEGALALAWTAAVPIYFAAMFWKNILVNNSVMYVFAYFSGVLLAEAYRQAYVIPQNGTSAKPVVNDNTKTRMPEILNVGRANRLL